MTKCAVLFCKNYSNRTSNFSFHIFPTDPLRKRKWVEAVRRERTWIPNKHHSICSAHFEPGCYNNNAKKQKKLHKDAVPTLNLPEFPSLENSNTAKLQAPDHDEKPSTHVNLPGSHIMDEEDTPRKRRLIQNIKEKNKKIKILQQQNRCLKNKISSLQDMLDELCTKSLITDEDSILVHKIGGQTKDLLKIIKISSETGKVP